VIYALGDKGVSGKLPKPAHSIGLGTARVVVLWRKNVELHVVSKEFTECTIRKIKHIAATHLKEPFEDLLIGS
jgi:hypothetical protein